jgi:putative membrane protein
MISALINLVLSTVAVMTAAYLIPAVEIESFWVGMVLAIVLALINTFIKPVLTILTFPISVVTLGLFSLVINAVLVLLASSLVPGFEVPGFFSALLFGLLLGLINVILGGLKG